MPALLLTICIPSRPRPSFGKAELGRAAPGQRCNRDDGLRPRTAPGVHPNLAVFFTGFSRSGSAWEAAYACQAFLSWQTTVVGDPLYRPSGGHPKPARDLVSSKSKSMEWWHLKVVNMSLASDPPSVNQSILAASVGTRTKRCSLGETGRSLFFRRTSPGRDCRLSEGRSSGFVASTKSRIMLELGRTLGCQALPRRPMPFTGSSSKRFRIIPTCWRSTDGWRFCQNLNRPEERDRYQKEIDRLTSNGTTRSEP